MRDCMHACICHGEYEVSNKDQQKAVRPTNYTNRDHFLQGEERISAVMFGDPVQAALQVDFL